MDDRYARIRLESLPCCALGGDRQTPGDPFQGRQVWIGQISRDIGLRLTSKTLVTHKIDPDVDENRDYLLQDLIRSEYVKHFGYVGGVGAATIASPGFNYTGDPYWTDGLCAISELSAERVPPAQVSYLDWAEPEGHGTR